MDPVRLMKRVNRLTIGRATESSAASRQAALQRLVARSILTAARQQPPLSYHSASFGGYAIDCSDNICPCVPSLTHELTIPGLTCRETGWSRGHSSHPGQYALTVTPARYAVDKH
jgi:hypothetical protein